jgi:hypothetical protein
MILHLVLGPEVNGYLSYGAWAYYWQNGYYAFNIYYNPVEFRWEIQQYISGPGVELIAYSPNLEGLFTYNPDLPGGEAGLTPEINEGDCQSICVTVTYNDDVTFTKTATFYIVDDLYNGKKYYAGQLNNEIHIIRYEFSNPPTYPIDGWYLIDPNPLNTSPIGWVIDNNGIPDGLWYGSSPYYLIVSSIGLCEITVDDGLNLTNLGVPEWIWQNNI